MNISNDTIEVFAIVFAVYVMLIIVGYAMSHIRSEIALARDDYIDTLKKTEKRIRKDIEKTNLK